MKNKIFIIGTQIRKRFCGNPTPIPPGKKCRGNDEQTRKCLLKKCPGKNNILQLAKFNVVVLENLGTNLFLYHKKNVFFFFVLQYIVK